MAFRKKALRESVIGALGSSLEVPGFGDRDEGTRIRHRLMKSMTRMIWVA
ncbi:hypothetical protein IKQ74_03975 [Candidatus Saccharibacteria bacterium]|nr:hypothetical protein [Candidatus Saccharibacteria bacterium]